MAERTLLLRNVRPDGGETVDVLIRDGRIARIAPGLPADTAEQSIDGENAILLPGLIEAHTHLDKNLLGMGWRPHQAGPSLKDKIETERRLRREWDIDPHRQSMRQALLSLGHGSTAIRSHVDMDTDCGMEGFEGVSQTRTALAGLIDIQIVAFPQSGLLVRPGTFQLMDEALRQGADVVGGLDPCSMDRDPKGHLEAVFSLAERHGKPVDIHLHEPGELGAFSIELILEHTRVHGMQGQVTISHAFCLGMPDRDRALSLIDDLAEARVHIATVATPFRPVPLADDLRAAGVTLCAGSDGIRDCWGPYGNADMLERAMHLGLRNNFRRDEDIEYALWCCTHGGAQVMGLNDYGLTEGCRADLVLVEAETPAHAVVNHPPRKLILKAGRVVAKEGRALLAAP
ncbi:amidohydrolase family protein [Aestuariicoccus sp. MJ-SS9]|uniref:amidohydrolase family protein n=1 Tax=Aestuariicoccus sp. MJ-SS9 TaxID=3079855 RepID=UPI0029104364|nr:amidohydrolase family protein [Aestuariicoccus sp. MJ-SS9]MDU8911016.1 amidohydrolase family protein [Aestuariicoccus sp. MJ-SS9]